MRVLVVFEDHKLRDLISFYLDGRFQMSIREAVSPEEAIALLSDEQEAFDILLCEYNPGAKKLISFAVNKSIDLHFLCSADKTPEDPMLSRRKDWIHFFSRTNFIQGLESTLRDLFKEFQAEKPLEGSEFIKIKPQLLLAASPLKGNVYVRLSDVKYVRILREGFDFDVSDFDYFINKKKISTLYIKKSQCNEFAVMIQTYYFKKKDIPNKAATNVAVSAATLLEEKKKRIEYLKAKARALEAEKLAATLDNSEAERATQTAQAEANQKALELKRQAMIRATAQEILSRKTKASDLVKSRGKDKEAEEARKAKEEELKRASLAKKLEKDLGAELEIIQEMSTKLGFTKEVQEITKRSVMQTIHNVRSAPKLSALLMQIRKEKEKYISSHSMLLAYVGCALSSQMEWSSDTTFQKITLAAFLHDSSLTNHELAEIQTLGQLAQNGARFTKEEHKAFREHPIIASEMARKFTEVPPDVDSIIIQHHERPDGSGFPRGMTHSRIGPLATVFIVAHDLVRFLIANEGADSLGSSVSLEKFLEQNSKTYQFGNFRKVLSVVPKIKV